ncbi:MAG: AMP-binding protein [Planctomycetota bacterium]|nr:AMP-binding protein [Planctomycetota bacterium]
MAEANCTVLDLLERFGKKTPASPAVVLPDRVVTYGELLASGQRLGRVLQKEATSPVVALFFPMSAEFVAAYFGVLYAGKQALPLNLMLPPEELKWIVDDAAAKLIVAPGPLAAKVAPLGVRVLDYAALAQAPDQGLALPPRPAPDDVCTLLYTSGTTGRPKGVMLTHRNLASNADNGVAAVRLGPANRLLACLPSFHTFAITGTVLAPLAIGASLAPMPRFDPEGVLKTASALKCDTLMMVPSMYRLVTRMQERRPCDMKHLRLAIAGGEPLPEEVRAQFEKVFGIPLLQGYGQTESGPVISFNTPGAHMPGTAGRPIGGVEVRIVNAETLQALPTGQTGEIWIKSPGVMKGYHNRPEETARTITPDGWLRTGDMGELTPEGYIRITGRLREMVKVAGEMVFPAEVENALLQHPAVLEAGVVGVKDERKGEAVKAFVALKPDARADEEQLLQHCRSLLAPYKVPRAIEFRRELPKGPTGKVMRRLLN